MVPMSKKSKKQRAKARKAQERRESGIVLRAVTAPPSAGGKLIELKPSSKNATAVEPPQAGVSEAKPAAVSSPPAARDEGAAPDVAPRNAIVPAKLGSEVEAPKETRDEADAPKVDAPAVAEDVASNDEPARAPLEEHRSSRRVSVEVDIHLSSDSHFFSGLSGDISEGGLFFSTYRPLTVGTQVDVEFSLPRTERAIHARGEVRWIREHLPEQPRGVGIAFEELSDEDRDAIHAFCSARPPLYYEDVG